MIIIKRLSLFVFFTLLVGISHAVSTEPTSIDGNAVEHTVSLGTYFAGIVGILLCIGIGYGLKRIYDVSRESY